MRRLYLFLSLLSLTACCGFLLMLPFAYHFYTSVGLDFEQARGERWTYTYLRLRWPGDGSVLLGGEKSDIARLDRPPDVIDLGARFFKPARPPQPRSWANRWGFWLVHGRDGSDPQAVSSFWIGVPAFVPVGLTALLAALWNRAWRRTSGFRKNG